MSALLSYSFQIFSCLKINNFSLVINPPMHKFINSLQLKTLN